MKSTNYRGRPNTRHLPQKTDIEILSTKNHDQSSLESMNANSDYKDPQAQRINDALKPEAEPVGSPNTQHTSIKSQERQLDQVQRQIHGIVVGRHNKLSQMVVQEQLSSRSKMDEQNLTTSVNNRGLKKGIAGKVNGRKKSEGYTLLDRQENDLDLQIVNSAHMTRNLKTQGQTDGLLISTNKPINPTSRGAGRFIKPSRKNNRKKKDRDVLSETAYEDFTLVGNKANLINNSPQHHLERPKESNVNQNLQNLNALLGSYNFQYPLLGQLKSDFDQQILNSIKYEHSRSRIPIDPIFFSQITDVIAMSSDAQSTSKLPILVDHKVSSNRLIKTQHISRQQVVGLKNQQSPQNSQKQFRMAESIPQLLNAIGSMPLNKKVASTGNGIDLSSLGKQNEQSLVSSNPGLDIHENKTQRHRDQFHAQIHDYRHKLTQFDMPVLSSFGTKKRQYNRLQANLSALRQNTGTTPQRQAHQILSNVYNTFQESQGQSTAGLNTQHISVAQSPTQAKVNIQVNPDYHPNQLMGVIGERTLTLRDHFSTQEEDSRRKRRQNSQLSQISQFSIDQKPVFKDSIIDEDNAQQDKETPFTSIHNLQQPKPLVLRPVLEQTKIQRSREVSDQKKQTLPQHVIQFQINDQMISQEKQDTENIQQSNMSQQDQSADPSTQIGHYSVLNDNKNQDELQTAHTQDSNRQKIMPDELSALLMTDKDESKTIRREGFNPQFKQYQSPKSSAYDYACMDYIAEKASDFITFQEQLQDLEYNCDNKTLDRKASKLADLILKEVSLLTKSKNSKDDNKNVFDVNQRKDMQIEKAPPRSLINFTNKSEQDRFMRLAKLIISLQRVKHDDVSFVYQRIFRFLSDLLTTEEFQELSYYHITRLINKINEVSNIDAALAKNNKKPPSLKEFIYQALDINYSESTLTKEQMKQIFGMSNRNPIWHDANGCDPNEFYSPAMAKMEVQMLPKTKQQRNSMLVGYISGNTKIKAHENSLNTILDKSYYQGKTDTTTHLLTRLLKKEKKLGLDHSSLTKESQIRRNKLVVEHVCATRNRQEWEQEVLIDIQEELKKSQRIKPNLQLI